MLIRTSTKRALITLLTLAIAHGASHAAAASVGTADDKSDPAHIAGPFTNAPANQVLARVGGNPIYARQLEGALASSPLATSFISMNEDDQARVRGDMLQRLISSELIHLAAVDDGIQETATYKNEMAAYRTGLLAQSYLRQLRTEVTPPDEVMTEIKERLRGDVDAQEAAIAAYVAQRYPELKAQRMAALREKFGLKIYPARITVDGAADTVVAEGDGLSIRLGDLRGGIDASNSAAGVELMRQRLEDSAQTILLARAAEDAGLDVSYGLEHYGHDLASRLLLRKKQQSWVPDEAAKRAWFKAHPDLGLIPTRWHVGQIVLKTREDAEKALKRIKAGESLFTLAGELSIDPYGRDQNGDMGWLRAGQGVEAIEKVLDGLDDGEVSDVIETPLGFHIVTVLERRPGSQKTYEDVHDRVEQAMIANYLPDYLVGLEKKYGVVLDPENQDK